MFRKYIRFMYDALPTDAPGATTLDQVVIKVNSIKDSADKTIMAMQTKIDDLVKGNATPAEIKEWKESIAKNAADIKLVNEYVEKLQKEGIGKPGAAKTKSLRDELGEIMEKNHEAITKNKGGKTPLEFDAKAIIQKADMSFTNNTTGTVVAPEYNPVIYGPPNQVPHIRTFINVGTTSSNAYWYTQAKLKTGSPVPGIIDPGQLKTQIEYQFDGVMVPVIKIAGYLRLPEEMVDDIEGMTSFLQNYLPEEVLKVEDAQILRGTGTANKQFNGLFTTSPVYTPSAGVDPLESWDVLADANAQLLNKWYVSTRTLVNPIDWMFLATRKSTDGIYSTPTLLYNAPLSIAGVQVTPHPLVNIDQFLTGWFPAAELKIKRGLTVRFYDQDQDNAIRNMITVVAEERAAFANYYPDAFLQGDFGRVS